MSFVFHDFLLLTLTIFFLLFSIQRGIYFTLFVKQMIVLRWHKEEWFRMGDFHWDLRELELVAQLKNALTACYMHTKKKLPTMLSTCWRSALSWALVTPSLSPFSQPKWKRLGAIFSRRNAFTPLPCKLRGDNSNQQYQSIMYEELVSLFQLKNMGSRQLFFPRELSKREMITIGLTY